MKTKKKKKKKHSNTDANKKSNLNTILGGQLEFL